MIELSRRLTSRALAALADLEARTVAVDGGRLKLEWGTLRSRTGRRVDDVLYWDGDRLIGFVGLYAFGGGPIELAGMVDPASRRAGIGTQLLDAALRLVGERGQSSALLVTPRSSDGGRALARSRGATLSHCEHALALTQVLPAADDDPAVRVRPATRSDIPAVVALLAEGFGQPPEDFADNLEADVGGTVVIELSGSSVGTLRRELRDGVGSIYGFVIASRHRGQGIGRAALRQVCRQLQDDGAASVRLEVLVDNESALGLYTSTGFEPVTTEDYYEVPIT